MVETRDDSVVGSCTEPQVIQFPGGDPMLALKLKEVELEIKRQEHETELLRVRVLQLEVEKADEEAAIRRQSMGPEGPIPWPRKFSSPMPDGLANGSTLAWKLCDVVPLKGTFMCDVPVGDAPVFAPPKEKIVPIVPETETPDLMSQKELAVAQRADSTLLHCFTLIDKQGKKATGYTMRLTTEDHQD
ncbi:hypothetical protein P4O66_021133 [Electrophorus voltai]|uniref:Uncharacterized protein n=1 Tax=Electrophorus voltai TaxID=2609070 RepID=A0AAD9E460_9TELE|nr:hypothetical protein P4O66_021133 [Electrophorus voltai]